MNYKRMFAVAAAAVVAIGFTACGGGATNPYLTGDAAVEKAKEFTQKLESVAQIPEEQLQAAYPGIDFSFATQVSADATVKGYDAKTDSETEEIIHSEMDMNAGVRVSLSDPQIRVRANLALDGKSGTAGEEPTDKLLGGLDLQYQLNPLTRSDFGLIKVNNGTADAYHGAQANLAYIMTLLGAMPQPPETPQLPDINKLAAVVPGADMAGEMLAFLGAQAEAVVKSAMSVRESDGKFEFELDMSKVFTPELMRAVMEYAYRTMMPNDGSMTDAVYEATIAAAVEEALAGVKLTASGKIYLAVTFNAEGIPVAAELKITALKLLVKEIEKEVEKVVVDFAVTAELKIQSKSVTVAEITLADMQKAYPDLTDLNNTPTLASLMEGVL